MVSKRSNQSINVSTYDRESNQDIQQPLVHDAIGSAIISSTSLDHDMANEAMKAQAMIRSQEQPPILVKTGSRTVRNSNTTSKQLYQIN